MAARLARRRSKEPGMSVEVARSIRTSIGIIVRRLDDLRASIARPLEMHVHIGKVESSSRRTTS
jgi:hypothetical protein